MSKSLETPPINFEKEKKEMPVGLKKAFDEYLEHINELITSYKDSFQRGVFHQYEKDKLRAKLKLAEDFLRNSRDDLSLLSEIKEFLDFKGHQLTPGEILLALQDAGYNDKIYKLENDARNSSVEDVLTKKRVA